MKNEDFRRVWLMLDRDVKERVEFSDGLKGLHASMYLDLAERMRAELAEFQREVVARFKAEAESARSSEAMMRERVGDAYDATPAEYGYGLDFSNYKQP